MNQFAYKELLISALVLFAFYACKHHPDPEPTDNCVTPIEIKIDSTVDASCGDSIGLILVSSTGGSGSGYTYSIDGTNFQDSPKFENLPSGIYFITAKDSEKCTTVSDSIIINNLTDMTVSTTSVDANCSASDGSITISVTGGVAPYVFSIDSGFSFHDDSVFTNKKAGVYHVLVKDSTGCIKQTVATIDNIASSLAFTYTTSIVDCNSSNGDITVTATGGTGGYKYSKNGGAFLTSNYFGNLNYGTFTISVKDANNCIVSQFVTVTVNSPSYSADIASILATSCSSTSCHGTPNSNKPALNTWSAVNSIKNKIKSELQSNSMPPVGSSISSTDKGLILCWIYAGALNN